MAHDAKPPPQARHFLVLALAWTAFAIYGSLVPLNYQPIEWAVALERFRNLPPLWFGMGSRADWVANILLFVPVTFLWMGAITCDRGRAARTFWAGALIPLSTATAIALEFTQIWFAGRTVSLNDILAETIGGAIGVLLWLGAGRALVRWLRSYATERQPRSQLEWLLGAYVIGLVIYSVIPLDLTVSLTELYHKWQSGQVLLVPFSYPYESATTVVYQFFADTVEFVPVGAWAALALRRRARVSSPLISGVAAGALLAVAIEFAQLLVLSRFTDVTDILFGSAGAAVGAWLVARGDERSAAAERIAKSRTLFGPAAFWLAVLAGYSLFLAVGFWLPFDFSQNRDLVSARYQDFFRVPFLALYQGSEFNAIKQALVRMLLFAPVGVIWAYIARLAASRPIRLGLGALGFVYAAVLAFGIEAVQILMPSKVADFTEVLLCTAGAAGGLLVTGRLLDAAPAAPAPVAPLATGPALGAPPATARAPAAPAPRPVQRRMLRVVRLHEDAQPPKKEPGR